MTNEQVWELRKIMAQINALRRTIAFGKNSSTDEESIAILFQIFDLLYTLEEKINSKLE